MNEIVKDPTEMLKPDERLNFISHRQLSPSLYIFTEGYSMIHRFTIGVVVGTEKIFVIDAGMGLGGSLRKAIEDVVGSEKPMEVLCTHCHPDHVGSAIFFDKAYVSYKDWPARADFALSLTQRLEDLHGFSMENAEVQRYCETVAIDNKDTKFFDIKDGDVFDAGGIQLLSIELPGHSDGSMAFYNKKENYVFTGDAVNTDTSLKKLDKQGFRNYKKTLERFISIVGEDATVYPAHLPLTMDMSIAHNLAAICDELAEGKTLGDPPGETIFTARANNPDIRMHYHNNTCIVYNRRIVMDSE